MKRFHVRLYRDLSQAATIVVEAESREAARAIAAGKVSKGELPGDLVWESSTYQIAEPIGFDVDEVTGEPLAAA